MTEEVKPMTRYVLPLALWMLFLVGCGGSNTADVDPAGPADPEPDTTPRVALSSEEESKFWEDDPSADAEWSTLRMRFVYDGSAPTPAPIELKSDPAFCSQKPPVNEQLLVNAENGGIKNVVGWLYLRNVDPPTPHPSYNDTATAEVVLDNQFCRFEPHVQLIRTGQSLKVRNLDQIAHNTKADFDGYNCPTFNTTIPAGGEMVKSGYEEGVRLPMPLQCTIHPWMASHLLVQEHPYMAVSDDDGRLEIKNLPPGEWTFQIWHEATGYVSEIDLNGADTTWKRGRFTQELEPGYTNLGVVVVKKGLFKN